ncbi:type II toxin-antitoxin system RelE/ParE family toxin [Roseibacillus persicicus]|uniref:Plasmid stabilization protein n=1 Tax=Roseibacillus persicicus TaxID=454148 RepID=A0A918TXR1_9BACT|nr:plasmid stabilization protein [Roseibacillus persicicus]
MARLIWAEPALQDLEQIADYIALDDPEAARRLVQRVFTQVELLEQLPDMCPVPHDLPDSRYRHLVVGPLRIFHRLEGNAVYIVYVMRSERNLKLIDIQEREQ